MLLRDMECQKCELISEVDSREIETILFCESCNKETNHKTVCNGGTKTRYRFCDWGGVDFSGQCEAHTTGYTKDKEGNKQPILGKDGKELGTFVNDKEKRAEKMDRIKFNLDNRR